MIFKASKKTCKMPSQNRWTVTWWWLEMSIKPMESPSMAWTKATLKKASWHTGVDDIPYGPMVETCYNRYSNICASATAMPTFHDWIISEYLGGCNPKNVLAADLGHNILHLDAMVKFFFFEPKINIKHHHVQYVLFLEITCHSSFWMLLGSHLIHLIHL